jgi:hypothetical protein
MARYFFHLRNGDTLLAGDDEGEELQDLEAVRHYAIQRPRDFE